MSDQAQSPIELLDNLQHLTQQMLEQIQQADINKLNELEQQRQSIIEEYRATSIDKFPSEVIGQKLLSVVELDKTLNSLCMEVREQLSTQLQEIQNGKRVKEAYRKNTI